jgi:uncharacterized membrane protein YqaE (UPF0057 family)
MLLAILLPWLSFLLRGKILSGIVCLVLQCTLIGWLPAALWAINSRSNAKTDKKLKQMENRLTNQK